MKYVTVCDPVQLVGRDGKAPSFAQTPTSFHDFLMDNVCAHNSIGNGIEGAKRVRKLDRLFRDAKPGDRVPVEDADHKAIMSVLETVAWAHPGLAAQLLPFMEALESASSEALTSVSSTEKVAQK